MKRIVFLLSAVILVFSMASCSKEATGKDAAKELFDSLKVIYENGLAKGKEIPINDVIACRERMLKKYEQQMKNETFKKEFEEQSEVFKKDLEKILQKYTVPQTIINVPADSAKSAAPPPAQK